MVRSRCMLICWGRSAAPSRAPRRGQLRRARGRRLARGARNAAWCFCGGAAPLCGPKAEGMNRQARFRLGGAARCSGRLRRRAPPSGPRRAVAAGSGRRTYSVDRARDRDRPDRARRSRRSSASPTSTFARARRASSSSAAPSACSTPISTRRRAAASRSSPMSTPGFPTAATSTGRAASRR